MGMSAPHFLSLLWQNFETCMHSLYPAKLGQVLTTSLLLFLGSAECSSLWFLPGLKFGPIFCVCSLAVCESSLSLSLGAHTWSWLQSVCRGEVCRVLRLPVGQLGILGRQPQWHMDAKMQLIGSTPC